MRAHSIVRRLSVPVSDVIRRAETLAMPDEGMTLGEFEAAILRDVNPHDVPDLVRFLARKGAIWRSEKRGVVRLYRQRTSHREAAGQDAPEGAILCATAAILGDICRHLSRGEDRDASISALRLVNALRKHVEATGVDVDIIRKTIACAFSEDVLRLIYVNEPRLEPDNASQSLRVEPEPKSHRIKAGASLKDKVIHTIGRQGSKGCTMTKLQRSIRPLQTFKQLLEIITLLQLDGIVRLDEPEEGRRGRPAARLHIVALLQQCGVYVA